MKTFNPILAVAVTLLLSEIAAVRGQDAAAQDPMAKVQVEIQRAQAQAQQQMQNARQQMEQVKNQMAQIGGGGGSMGFAGGGIPAVSERLQSIVYGAAGGPGKTLVIRSSQADPKEQANLEEDLAVMSRVLDKAIAEKLGDERRGPRAMGIDVFFTPGPAPWRSMYLDGYGAVFMLNVNFPLLAPPTKTEEQKEKPQTDSAWQEARQELYGQSPGTAPSPQVAEEYSEEKVNQLKGALLEALKDATNIRSLKPDDSITVCVFGAASARSNKVKPIPKKSSAGAGSEPVNEYVAVGWNAAPMHGTIMTIRVKKSDADAFAKGKLNPDEFRKKAAITTYAGNAGNGSGGFGGGGFGGVMP